MPEKHDADPRDCSDGEDISGGVLYYTVGHENRVEKYAVETVSRLAEAVERMSSHGIVVPEYVRECIGDEEYAHDVKTAGANHDWAKGDWPIGLLCGDKRPSCKEWLMHIYPHPGLTAYHIHSRKGLEKALHITERAVEFLKCHHMRHDGNNLGFDGKDIWYKGEKVQIYRDREELQFYSQGPGIRWHKNMIMIGDKRTEYMGYGPMDAYLLEGESLQFGAEILKLVDAYDAMTSHRKHREMNRTHDEAIAELLAKSGIEFHPLVVMAFTLVPQKKVQEIAKIKVA